MFDLPRLLAETFIQRIEFHEELPSTNDLALRLAVDETLATPLLVLADRQTAGRGRGVNRWWSNDGALTFTLVGDFVGAAVAPAAGLRFRLSRPSRFARPWNPSCRATKWP